MLLKFNERFYIIEEKSPRDGAREKEETDFVVILGGCRWP